MIEILLKVALSTIKQTNKHGNIATFIFGLKFDCGGFIDRLSFLDQ
jgi:hypothetical protein